MYLQGLLGPLAPKPFGGNSTGLGDDVQAIPDGHAQLVVIEGGDLASGRVLQERRPVGLAPSASKFHADGIKAPCSERVMGC